MECIWTLLIRFSIRPRLARRRTARPLASLAIHQEHDSTQLPPLVVQVVGEGDSTREEGET